MIEISEMKRRLGNANRAVVREWTPEEEERAFQALAARYAATALEDRTAEDHADIARWVDADVTLSGLSSGRAIDLGAGEGRSTLRLRELGFDATGVERSPVVAARAPEGTVLVGTAEDIPVGDGSQDLVLCNSLFEHVLDPERVLREIHRILTPGGVCILHTTNRHHWRTGEITFPAFQWLPRRARAWIWHLSGRDHISPHFFTYNGLCRMAEAAGFDVVVPWDDMRTRHTGLYGAAVRVWLRLLDTPPGRAYMMFKSSVVELRLTRR